jgi:ribosome-associated protein YbcJ (S4-like RNA binding protein)
MGISEANLSRYLNTLKVKGLIVKGDNNKWIINDNIIPVFINDSVEINFTLNIQEDDTIETRKIHGEYSQEKQK